MLPCLAIAEISLIAPIASARVEAGEGNAIAVAMIVAVISVTALHPARGLAAGVPHHNVGVNFVRDRTPNILCALSHQRRRPVAAEGHGGPVIGVGRDVQELGVGVHIPVGEHA